MRWQVRFTLRCLFCDKKRITEERIERYVRCLQLPGARESLIAQAEQIVPENSQEIIAQIPTIRVPTSIIWGENDPAIPLQNALRLHREINASRLAIIPRCGHVPQEEQPFETARILADFCQ